MSVQTGLTPYVWPLNSSAAESGVEATCIYDEATSMAYFWVTAEVPVRHTSPSFSLSFYSLCVISLTLLPLLNFGISVSFKFENVSPALLKHWCPQIRASIVPPFTIIHCIWNQGVLQHQIEKSGDCRGHVWILNCLVFSKMSPL